MIHNGLLGNKAGKSVVSLNDLNRRRNGQKLPQATATVFRHGQFLAELLVNFARLLASGVWHLYERSAVCGEKPLNVVTDGAFGTVLPVVAMYYVIGLECCNHVVVKIVILDNDATHTFKRLVELNALFLGNRRKPTVSNESFITQGSYNHSAVFLRVPENVQMPLMNNVGTKGGIDNWHNNSFRTCSILTCSILYRLPV